MKMSHYLFIILLFIQANLIAQDTDGGLIFSGQTLSGKIDLSDRDVYQFRVNQDDRVLIDLEVWNGSQLKIVLLDHNSVQIIPSNSLLDPNHELEPYDRSLTFYEYVLQEGGDYRIIVYGDGGTSHYNLTFLNLQDLVFEDSEEDKDGDFLASGVTISGRRDRSDIDAYQFGANKGDRIFLDVEVYNGSQLNIVLLNHNGMPIVPSNGLLDPNSELDPYDRSLAFYDYILEEDGDYTIIVYGDAGTSYYDATFLNLDNKLSYEGDIDGGYILCDETKSGRRDRSDIDVYRFRGNGGDRVFIDVEVYNGAKLGIALLDPNYALEPFNRDMGFLGHPLNETGEYTVVLYASRGTSYYYVSYNNLNKCNPPSNVYVSASVSDSLEDGSEEHPFDTIQEAIGYAIPGATVVLEEGTYTGDGNRDISFLGKGITLRSIDPRNQDVVENTVIECNGTAAEPHRAFNFIEDEASTSVLDGLTIKGGYAPPNRVGTRDRSIGGAIRCVDASPTIRHCTIQSCFADDAGGAIYCSSSSPIIEDCNVIGNTSYGDGGGIYFEGSCKAEVRGGFIQSNHADRHGGGIANMFNRKEAIIDGCTVMYNTSARNGGAIGCIASPSVVIDNCTIGKNMALYEGGAFYFDQCSPLIADCSLFDNSTVGSGVFSRTDTLEPEMTLIGGIQISNEVWDVNTVLVDQDTILTFNDSTVSGKLYGPCTILVEFNSELTFNRDAVIDLSVASQTNVTGVIECSGLLRLSDSAKLVNAQVRIDRLSFEDYASVQKCIITAEAGTPYGQFLIEDSVHLSDCHIQSDGDRYLDMDPQNYIWDSNSMSNIKIDVTITEGKGTDIGGLFELRGKDGLRNADCVDSNFVCQITEDGVPSFNRESWSLNSLTLTADSKLNLTNRFDYQTIFDESDRHDEALYVKDLILEPNSILNTSFHRVYYENLEKDSTAKIVDVPLLGFSLNNISFNDAIDYETRIENNNIDFSDLNDHRLLVDRETDNPFDPCGVMVMRNLNAIDPDGPGEDEKLYHARAKALFDKASEDEILIQFEYVWNPDGLGNRDDPGELVIYLSDTEMLMDPSDPNWHDHYLKVGSVFPPAADYPGDPESGRLALFTKIVPKEHLNFINGTRVEFQLLGPSGTSILIDNWDPIIINCESPVCGDISLFHEGTSGALVDELDFLTVMAVCGNPSATNTKCLDLAPFGSGDGYLTVDDAISPTIGFGLCLNNVGRISNPNSSQDAHSGFVLDPPDTINGQLMILGKSYNTGSYRSECLYIYGNPMQSDQNPQENLCIRSGTAMNRRLVNNPFNGCIYQLNEYHGLIKTMDKQGHKIHEKIDLTANKQMTQSIQIGLQQDEGGVYGLPLLDAAFDSQGNLYLVPVVVRSTTGENDAYVAAVKIFMQDEEPNGVFTVYYCEAPEEPSNLSNLCEIELDSLNNVYVLNRKGQKSEEKLISSDWLFKFGHDNGRVLERVRLQDSEEQNKSIIAPGVLLASQIHEKVYLTSLLNEPEGRNTEIYALSSHTLEVSTADTIAINEMGHITGMTESTDGALWVTGFMMSDIPQILEIDSDHRDFNPMEESPFYWPCLATVDPTYSSNLNPTAITLTQEYQVDNDDLALPLSIMWIGD